MLVQNDVIDQATGQGESGDLLTGLDIDGADADGQESDQKPEEGTGQEGEEDQGEDFQAPESYELTLPEGYEFDEETLEELTPWLKDMGFSNEEAQQLADFHVKALQRYEDRKSEQWDNEVNNWADRTRKDPEIGGQKLGESLANGRKVLEAFGTKEVFQTLENSGLATHPEFVRLFSRIGKLMVADDKFLAGAGAGAKDDASGYGWTREMFAKSLGGKN